MNSNALKSLGKLSIEEVLDNIEGSRFFIPSLQRDFVWAFDRIEKFFDSLYREFPISNIILIKIDNEDKNIISFYKLKDRFSKEDILTNDLKTRFSNNESLYCILDGQQRLTALYAGFNCIIPKKSFSKNETVYKMVLCFNLLHDGEDDSIFKFKKIDDNEIIPNELWVPVRQIEDEYISAETVIERLTVEKVKKEIFLKKNNEYKKTKKAQAYIERENIIKSKQSIIKSNLNKFLNMKKRQSITYQVISLKNYTNKQETLLEIFLRLNSGGKPLTPADLLYSKITVSTEKYDFKPREVFSEYIQTLNKGENDYTYSFTIDFFMRALWYIYGNSSFKTFLLSDVNDYCYTENFKRVFNSLKQARDCYQKCGYEPKSMSYNALLPIAYYFYHQGIDDENTNIDISKYFAIANLLGYFGSHSDSTLLKFKKAMQNNVGDIKLFTNKIFNLSLLQEGFNRMLSTKETQFLMTKEKIKNLIEKTYNNDYSVIRGILFLLNNEWIRLSNSNTIAYEVDHLHPKSFADEQKYHNEIGDKFDQRKYEFFIANVNKLANLQILDKKTNSEEKKDLSLLNWLNKNYKKGQKTSFLERNLIKYEKDKDLELYNFDIFYEKRKKLILNKLYQIFNLK